jgi:hypothetical protein
MSFLLEAEAKQMELFYLALVILFGGSLLALPVRCSALFPIYVPALMPGVFIKTGSYEKLRILSLLPQPPVGAGVFGTGDTKDG